LPEELVMSIVPTNGRLTVPEVTEGLVPHEYRQVLTRQFEEQDV
jgi:hypothetical protein